MILHTVSYPLIPVFESHYQINHNEQTHSEIRSSWNDLSSPSDMNRINEILNVILNKLSVVNHRLLAVEQHSTKA